MLEPRKGKGIRVVNDDDGSNFNVGWELFCR